MSLQEDISWPDDVDLPCQIAGDALWHMLTTGPFKANDLVWSGGDIVDVSSTPLSSEFLDYFNMVIGEGHVYLSDVQEAIWKGAKKVSDLVVSEGYDVVETRILYGDVASLEDRQSQLVDLNLLFLESFRDAVLDENGQVVRLEDGRAVVDVISMFEVLGEFSAYLSYACFPVSAVGYDVDQSLGISGDVRDSYWAQIELMEISTTSTAPSYTAGVYDLQGWEELGGRQTELRPMTQSEEMTLLYLDAIDYGASFWKTQVEDGPLSTLELASEAWVTLYSIGMLYSRMNVLAQVLDDKLEGLEDAHAPDIGPDTIGVQVLYLAMTFALMYLVASLLKSGMVASAPSGGER